MIGHETKEKTQMEHERHIWTSPSAQEYLFSATREGLFIQNYQGNWVKASIDPEAGQEILYLASRVAKLEAEVDARKQQQNDAALTLHQALQEQGRLREENAALTEALGRDDKTLDVLDQQVQAWIALEDRASAAIANGEEILEMAEQNCEACKKKICSVLLELIAVMRAFLDDDEETSNPKGGSKMKKPFLLFSVLLLCFLALTTPVQAFAGCVCGWTLVAVCQQGCRDSGLYYACYGTTGIPDGCEKLQECYNQCIRDWCVCPWEI